MIVSGPSRAPQTPADERIETTGQPLPGDLLLHPVALVALAVVIFNDRFLKLYHPGLVSGKLSDFAGLIYFPLFVVTLIELARWISAGRSRSNNSWATTPRWVDVTAVITGVIFALAKVWTLWADGYRTFFGIVWWPVDAIRSLVAGNGWPPLGRLSLTQDASDLIALPVLLIPGLIARHVTARRGITGTSATT